MSLVWCGWVWVWYGWVWFGVVEFGLVWMSMVLCGWVRFGIDKKFVWVWLSSVCYEWVWFAVIEFDLVRLTFLWFGRDLNKNVIVDAWMEDKIFCTVWGMTTQMKIVFVWWCSWGCENVYNLNIISQKVCFYLCDSCSRRRVTSNNQIEII